MIDDQMNEATYNDESEYSLRQNFGWISIVFVHKRHLSTRAGVLALLQYST